MIPLLLGWMAVTGCVVVVVAENSGDECNACDATGHQVKENIKEMIQREVHGNLAAEFQRDDRQGQRVEQKSMAVAQLLLGSPAAVDRCRPTKAATGSYIHRRSGIIKHAHGLRCSQGKELQSIGERQSPGGQTAQMGYTAESQGVCCKRRGQPAQPKPEA